LKKKKAADDAKISGRIVYQFSSILSISQNGQHFKAKAKKKKGKIICFWKIYQKI
jgi:hypothetical protein